MLKFLVFTYILWEIYVLSKSMGFFEIIKHHAELEAHVPMATHAQSKGPSDIPAIPNRFADSFAQRRFYEDSKNFIF
jgi:hypothetical protein